MTIEQQQVNVQDLQRLSEAINVTIDCIRRVAPQLTQIQMQTGQYGIQQPFGFGQHTWGQQGLGQIGFGHPYGFHPLAQLVQPQTPFVDPWTAAYVQNHVQALRSALGPQLGQTTFGQAMQQPFGYTPWMQASPLASLMQRPF